MNATIATTPVSRRLLIKGAGAAGLSLTLGQTALLRTLAAESETVQDIVNIASTAESLAVTLLGGAIDSAKQGHYNQKIPDAVISILVAARSSEQYHLDYLLGAGAKPLTQTFTVPDPKLLSDYDTLFGTIVQLESAFIAAYGAAMRQFTALKQPELVKVAYQVGTVEAEHRVLANYALGTRPANNRSFEQAKFTKVSEAADALTKLGFIGGDGTRVAYPGPGDVDKSAVTETTPGGPKVDCWAATDMSVTGSGTAAKLPAGDLGFAPMAGILGLFGLGAAAAGARLRRREAPALIDHEER